jgi:hypothetical protein
MLVIVLHAVLGRQWAWEVYAEAFTACNCGTAHIVSIKQGPNCTFQGHSGTIPLDPEVAAARYERYFHVSIRSCRNTVAASTVANTLGA